MNSETIQNEEKSENTINRELCFQTPIYVSYRKDLVDITNKISDEYLDERRKEIDAAELKDALAIMSGNYFGDERLKELVQYIGQGSYDILNSQGYDLTNMQLFFTEMWTHEHHKYSNMDYHVHGNSCITGFYFLEVPENSSRVLFHDPRQAKVFSNLPEKNVNDITIASQTINFTPTPGMVIFTNAWLPHSFSRHMADSPLKFVHFNLSVRYNPNIEIPLEPMPDAEIV